MKTPQVAEILGMSANQLLQIIHRHEIQVPKDVDRYVWNEAHIEEVREALRRDEDYTAFGLEQARAEHFLERPEPLAWGLSTLMEPRRWSRAAHARDFSGRAARFC